MRTVLFAAILLTVASVPAAYASTLQLVTENGNVFSIDFDEILRIWEGYNPSNQTQAIAILQQQVANLTAGTIPTTNSTGIDDLQDRIDELVNQLNTNSTATEVLIDTLQDRIDILTDQLNSAIINSTSTEAEIDALQDTIDSLTEDLEELEGSTGSGSGIGFGYHPQVSIYDPENSVLTWGNSTHSDAASAGPYMRVGEVEHAALARSGDRFNSLTLPPTPGEYILSGGGVYGTNELYGYGSDWQDRGGWLELPGGSNVGDPGTAVFRLQDYYIKNKLIKVSGYAPDGATVRIVSSPNDLTRLAVEGDGFAPEVVPIDSYFNYTNVLVGTQYSSNSGRILSDISVDLFECRAGGADGWTYGHRCHNFAYPSYPAELYTNFYVRSCGDVVELDKRVRVNSVYINVAEDVHANYTRGIFLYHYTNAPDYQYTSTSSMNTPPEIECGPKIDGFHHVTKISQNKTVNRSGTYLFDSNGKLDGDREYGPFLEQIYGNVTLNTDDHIMHFNGTGSFEETVDLRLNVPIVTDVVMDLDIAYNVNGRIYLEAPDGQRKEVCGFPCNTASYSINFDPVSVEGDWSLYWSRSYRDTLRLNSWGLTFGTTQFPENVFDPPRGPGGSYGVFLGDTLTILNGTTITPYYHDLYLVATGMNMTNGTAMVRAVEYQISDADTATFDPSYWIINNMPSTAPYVITTVDGDLVKAGMSDRHGTITVLRDEMRTIPAEPVLLEYWPNSLTYAGRAHASGQGIMFDPYNNETVEFPWTGDDPLLYVAKAYVKLAIPVDGTSLGGARLANGDGHYVSYPYLVKTYDAGDEVYIPVYPAAQEIRLLINGDWVQSYIKDVQQNTQAYVFSGTDAIDTSLGGLSGYNAQPTATATMIATQDGGVIAVISATAGGGAVYNVNFDNSDGKHTSAGSLCRSTYSIGYCHYTNGLRRICPDWSAYLSANGATWSGGLIGSTSNYKGNPGIFASIYHNGELVRTVSGVGTGGEGTFTKTGYQGRTSCWVDYGDRSHNGPNSFANGWGQVHPDARVHSENPWKTNYRVDTSFTGATFSETLILENVKISDQIDFVVSVGIPGLYGDDKPLLLVGNYSNVDAHSKGNAHLEDGYILLYQ